MQMIRNVSTFETERYWLLAPLLQCLEEIKAWMALNFLNFNENKTEVMLFTPEVPVSR